MEHDYYTDYSFCMTRAVQGAYLAEDIRGGFFFASMTPAERMAAIRRSQDKAQRYALAAAKFLSWAQQEPQP